MCVHLGTQAFIRFSFLFFFDLDAITSKIWTKLVLPMKKKHQQIRLDLIFLNASIED